MDAGSGSAERSIAEIVGEPAAHDIDRLPAGAVGKAAGARSGDDRRRRFDRAEIVVQVFGTRDPVAGAKAELAAGAGDPAEPISWVRRAGELGCARNDDNGGVD